MIQVNNVSLKFGKRTLFEEVNIKFTNGNCYGLIGANGSGKSTFLKILSGEQETTTGEVVIGKDERMSFLRQDHYQYDEKRVIDVVIMGNDKLYSIMEEKNLMLNLIEHKIYLLKCAAMFCQVSLLSNIFLERRASRLLAL